MEIKLVTIKEYAKQKNITYEAVRKQIQKYKDDELKDHIIKKNKTQFLDEYAVDFLDNRRRESPVMLYQMEKDEKIEQLEYENKILLQQLVTVQDTLLKEKEKTDALLAEKKDEIALLAADNEAARQMATQAEKNAQEAARRLSEERKQFEDEKYLLQQEIDQLRKRTFWDYLFRKNKE